MFFVEKKMTFSQKVIKLTSKIPRGKVTTYKIIAKKLKCRAYRAVGNALSKNQQPIIIPCHRVVSSDGSTGGYYSGTDRKIHLLQSENIAVKNRKIIGFERKLFKF